MVMPKKPKKRKSKPWTKARRIKHLWACKPGRSLTEIAEKVGTDAPYVCRVLQDAGIEVLDRQVKVRKEQKAEDVIKDRDDRVANEELSASSLALIDVFKAWRRDMGLFVEQALGVNGEHGVQMSTQQRDACERVSELVYSKEAGHFGWKMTEEQRELSKKIGISIMAGQGPGKDAWLSWLILWMLLCFQEVLIPCTAPTADQLKTVLWSEVGRWLYRRDPDGGFLVVPVVRKRIQILGHKIVLLGKDTHNFAFAKTANPKDDADAQARTLYGYHDKYMAIVVDEAAGVVEPVFTPLEGTLTDFCNFLVLVFNPIKSSGFAFNSQLGPFAHKWICLQWNSEESELVSKQHIADMAEKYGRQSNTFRTLVLGLPPKADPDTLIPYDWVMEAVERPMEVDKHDPLRGGLDPGAGGDNSVLIVRHGMKVIDIQKFSSPDTMETVHWAAGVYDDHGLDILDVDNIGIGLGVFDRLRELGYNVRKVDFRTTARDDERFVNKRAELWWKAREVFEDRNISIPDNQFLKEELWGPKFNPEGKRIIIESKATMKKRLEAGRSPNYADALIITFDAKDAIYRKRRASAVDDEDWNTPKPVDPDGWMMA